MYTNEPTPNQYLLDTLKDAEAIQNVLNGFTRDLALAIAAKKEAARVLKEVTADYSDAETLFTVELLYRDDNEIVPDAKGRKAPKMTVDVRKVLTEAALIKARAKGGELYAAWEAKKEAERKANDAEFAYQIADAQFRGIRYAANLQASILNAVVVA